MSSTTVAQCNVGVRNAHPNLPRSGRETQNLHLGAALYGFFRAPHYLKLAEMPSYPGKTFVDVVKR